jgi:hypothetical protein
MANQLALDLAKRAQSQRILAQEAHADKYYVRKPIGPVVGQWYEFKENGTGLVSYKGKIYEAKILAKDYARKNQKVLLTLTEEGNFVSW